MKLPDKKTPCSGQIYKVEREARARCDKSPLSLHPLAPWKLRRQSPVTESAQMRRLTTDGERMSTPYHRPPRSSNLANAQGSSTTMTAEHAAVNRVFIPKPMGSTEWESRWVSLRCTRFRFDDDDTFRKRVHMYPLG